MGKSLIGVLLLAVACSGGGSKAAEIDAGEDDPGGAGGGGAGGRDAGRVGGAGGAVVPVADARLDVAVDTGGAAPDAAAAPDASPDAAAGPAGNPFIYVGGGGARQIRIFELDMQSGALMARGSAPSGPSPNYLAFHPSGKYLYALNEVGDGRVEAFAIDGKTGMLTRLNDASSGGAGPAHLSVHKSGRWVLAANYGNGNAAALPIMEDGRLGAPVAPRFAGAQAHMILDDGVTGDFVFVPSKGDNRTLQFKFDVSTGRLEPNTPPFVAQAGSPRHMAFHRSGKYAFLLTEAGRSVISYRYDATTGLLSGGTALSASPSGDGAHIVLHPTRELLYTSMRMFNSIAIFTITADGRAQGPRQFQMQIARPWDTTIEATGQYLLVGNNEDGTVKVLRIDQESGSLSLVGDGASGLGAIRFVGSLYLPR
jgi:6-phosphogluconolactonase